MASRDLPQDLIGYDALQQLALRGIMRGALEHAASPGGLPGEHHFYISFKTGAPGVTLPDELRRRYPDEMTIVLQNQYDDLRVGPDGFSVVLHFANVPKTLAIPYWAVTRFVDPSVQFVMQLAAIEPASEPPPRIDAVSLSPPTAATDDASARLKPSREPADQALPKIVSLDQFRRR